MADGDGRSSPAAKPNFKPTSTRCVTRLETSVRDSAYASSERRRPALAGVWESLDKGAPPPRAAAPRNETPSPRRRWRARGAAAGGVGARDDPARGRGVPAAAVPAARGALAAPSVEWVGPRAAPARAAPRVKRGLALTVTVNGRGAATPGAPAPTAEKVAAFARRTRDAMEARRRGGRGRRRAESDATDAFLRARPAGDGDASDFAAAPWPAGRFALERHVPIPQSVAWNGLRSNYHADDDPVLRYVPYFGDDDARGIDVSAYEAVPESARQAADDQPDPKKRRLAAPGPAPPTDGGRGAQNAKAAPAPRNARNDANGRGLRVAARTYAELSESYRDLFCRRCFVYDCAQHGVRQPLPRARCDPVFHTEQEREAAWPDDAAYDARDRAMPPPPAFDAASALGFAPPGVFDGAADDVAEDVAAAPEPQLETGSPSPKKGAKRKRYQTGSNGLSLTLGKRKAKKIPAHSRWATAHAALFRRQKLALGSKGFASRRDTPHTFMPCNHDGPCDTDACSCVARGAAFCEKYCACGPDCRARFPGCRCAPNLDPERQGCRTAGACDCRVAIGRSCTHGWGAFALERCRVGDLVGEYRGELVSQDEADRRGKIYDKLNCSFLFNLDDELVVDATRKGAKMKFANHHADPNCAARVALVDGDHRIGLFAKREIAPGEELCFNYSAGFWESTQIESSAPTPDA
ncbi:hypothetical protein JL722_9783 [Aureococcus anophagefferens]|nr:hypothetical protein JL722_9783 [Aureococcus anophagefferens]